MAKDSLPKVIKRECLCIVQGYNFRVRRYHEQRQEIIVAGSGGYQRYIHTETKRDKHGGYTAVSEERWMLPEHGSGVGRPVEDKVIRLDEIEQYPETKKMRAVEEAKLQVGLDQPTEEARQRLTQGIILNCENGRAYPFEYLNITGISRSDFYRRRDEFLLEIAKYLKMI